MQSIQEKIRKFFFKQTKANSKIVAGVGEDRGIQIICLAETCGDLGVIFNLLM